MVLDVPKNFGPIGSAVLKFKQTDTQTDKQRIYVHKYSRHNERVCCTSTVQLNRVHNQEYTVRMQTLPVTLNPCMYVVQNNVNVIKVTISATFNLSYCC